MRLGNRIDRVPDKHRGCAAACALGQEGGPGALPAMAFAADQTGGALSLIAYAIAQSVRGITDSPDTACKKKFAAE